MPSLGMPELVIILVIAMLVFGVGKLGDAGAAVGKAVKEFRGAMKDVEGTAEDLKKTPVDGGDSSKPAAAPVAAKDDDKKDGPAA